MHLQASSISSGKSDRSAAAVQLSLAGLVVLCVSLVVATGLLTWFVTRPAPAPVLAAAPVDPPDGAPPSTVPPWGELFERDILLDRPDEYAAFELDQSERMDWTFAGATPDQVRAKLRACGLPGDIIEHALSSPLAQVSNDDVLIRPDAKLLTSLSPEMRNLLYAELGRNPKNFYQAEPFSFPAATFDSMLQGTGLSPATMASIRQLSYVRGDRTYFSDVGFVLEQLPKDPDRLKVLKVLSRIPAVLVRLRVRPTTDIDKLVNYWTSAPGVMLKDVRPLMESVKRLEGGGTVGLSYVLPPFAKERLYTFPGTTKSGEADVDCHWSAMNFFKSPPDNRFLDLAYTTTYIQSNYYPIADPTHYGDLVFVLNAEGSVIHSAVHIADDIVFTKNGKSFGQPWLLMHLKDLVSLYSAGTKTKLIYYRNNES